MYTVNCIITYVLNQNDRITNELCKYYLFDLEIINMLITQLVRSGNNTYSYSICTISTTSYQSVSQFSRQSRLILCDPMDYITPAMDTGISFS